MLDDAKLDMHLIRSAKGYSPRQHKLYLPCLILKHLKRFQPRDPAKANPERTYLEVLGTLIKKNTDYRGLPTKVLPPLLLYYNLQHTILLCLLQYDDPCMKHEL